MNEDLQYLQNQPPVNEGHEPESCSSSGVTNKRQRKSTSQSKAVAPNRLGGSYQRTKAPSACLVCRARKTRCDNVRPRCGFCQSTNGDCRYTESERSRFDPASIAILQQLDEIKTLLQQPQLSSNSPDDQSSSNSMFLTQSQPYAENPRFGKAQSSSASNFSEIVSPITPSYLSRLSTLTSNEQQHYDSGLAALSAAAGAEAQTTTKHDFEQYAARLQAASDVPISSEVMTRTTRSMGIEAMLLWPVLRRPLERLRLPTGVPLVALLDDQPVSLAAAQLSQQKHPLTMLLGRERIHQLVDNFLVNNNLKNPIFEPASLRQAAEEFAAAPYEWTGQGCLMFLVLAISCLSTSLNAASQGRSLTNSVQVSRIDSTYSLAEHYFYESQQRAGALTFEGSLLAAQCHFMTGVYLMYTLRLVPAWKAFVQAGTDCVTYFISRGRTAASPIMDYDAKTSEIFEIRGDRDRPSTSTTRALEDALYWSCLKSEVRVFSLLLLLPVLPCLTSYLSELRLELCLPGSGINMVQYPHVFPCVPDMDMESSERILSLDGLSATPSQPALDKEHLTSGWFFFLAEIALKRLTYNILQTRYSHELSLCSRKTHEEVAMTSESHQGGTGLGLDPNEAEYDVQLEQWMRLLPPAMQFPSASSEPLNDILPWVLRGHRIDAVEILRFPAFAAVFATDELPQAMTRLVVDTQFCHLVREYLQNAVHRIEANAEGLFHRHQGSWLAIRSCTRSALALLCTKLASQDLKQQQRLSVTALTLDQLLPPLWQSAVQLVLDMLRAWQTESPDVARLRAIVEGLLPLCER